ncbi:hypothetical protein [Brevundimonas sp.]|uniref:hypothetical protein n=1 Tax=Brevundimonas sp. TaxID=1871086 RepID=UPI002FCA157A
MLSDHEPKPPKGEGAWTLLQQRLERSFWQWDRVTPDGHSRMTRFVIVNDPSRLDFDDFEEAERMFERMGD